MPLIVFPVHVIALMKRVNANVNVVVLSQSNATVCAPGYTRICPRIGETCSEDMKEIYTTNLPLASLSRQSRVSNAAPTCDCVLDFLLIAAANSLSAPAEDSRTEAESARDSCVCIHEGGNSGSGSTKLPGKSKMIYTHYV